MLSVCSLSNAHLVENFNLKMLGNFTSNLSRLSLESAWNCQQLRFATKKAGGTIRNGRDSIGKRLGLKKSGGQHVIPGNIIIRQRGLSYAQGPNTGLGRDYTIWALTPGYVKFTWDPKKKRNIVSVEDVFPYPRQSKKVPEGVAVENL